MSTGDPQARMVHLLAWLSPTFPVGAFAYSHGLEAAVENGDIHDGESLRAWLRDLLECGSGRNDLVLAAAAHSAVGASDRVALHDTNDLALAVSPSRERRLETAAMGQAFATTVRAAWPTAACALLPEGEIAYPIAVGAACAVERLEMLRSLEAYGFAFLQNLVSAAVRLGPIGQTEGQKALAALLPVVLETAAFAAGSSLDDLGGCTLRSDLAAMRHETQYSRLFRS